MRSLIQKPESVLLKNTNLDEVTNWILHKDLSGQSGIPIRLVNTFSLGLATLDLEYLRLLSGNGVNLPDGKPPVVFNNLFRRKKLKSEQIRGIDLLNSVLSQSKSTGKGHFFLGSTDKVLDKMAINVFEEFGLTNVTFHQPGFISRNSSPSPDLIEKIRNSGSHIVWVGLGTPNQDFFAKRLADELPMLVIAIGAAFDYLSKEKKVANPFLVKLGLEWFFRLYSEPKRLVKRYLIISPLWLALLITRKIKWDSI